MAELLTPSEVAEALRLPSSTVYDLISRGELRAFRVGRHLRVRRDWLEELIERGAARCQARVDGRTRTADSSTA